MPKAKVQKFKADWDFLWGEKILGSVRAFSEKQAWYLWRQGFGEHYYPSIEEVESVLDRIQVKQRYPTAV